MESLDRKVCVIGSGIVGSASAYALARDGWKVTMVESRLAPGQGTSKGNAGQLVYSHVEPLATPAALRALPGWLTADLSGRDSPLKWRPRLDPAHIKWLGAFIWSCKRSRVQDTKRVLLSLSALSRETLHCWREEIPAAFDAAHFTQRGKLVLYRDPAQRAYVNEQRTWQSQYGAPQCIVAPDECLNIEPALRAGGGGPISFGLWTESEEAMDSERFAQELASASTAEILTGKTVVRFLLSGNAVKGAVLDTGQVVYADAFVIAAGIESVALAKTVGVKLPVEPIKGYSITMGINDFSAAPHVGITDTRRKMVFARVGQRLRVAGYAELLGMNATVEPRQIESLRIAASQMFPGACEFSALDPWIGHRPATPGGRPVIAATPLKNLWMNTGHGALGLTLAAGSATVLAALMTHRSSTNTLSQMAQHFRSK